MEIEVKKKRRNFIPFLAVLVLLAGAANADVLIKGTAYVTDLLGTITIDGAGTLDGAKYVCLPPLTPTTPDGDVVAGNDLYRITVRKAFTVTNVYGYLDATGTTDAVTIDINEAGTTILSTKLTIDASENDSTTAAVPAVISDTTIAANAVLNVDVDDQDGGNTAAGLEALVCGYYN